MSNVRISGLPLNPPTPSSFLPVEVMTSPGVFTTSKAQLSTFLQTGSDFVHFQSNFSTATALSAGWQTAFINLCAYAPSWIANNTLTSVNSARWSSAYNTVTAYFPYWQAGYNFSVGNGASVVSTVSANSGSWGGGQSVYTTVNTNSAAWQTAGTGGGVSVYNTVNPLSAAWTSSTKTVTALSANWSSVFTSVYPNSGNWNSVYTLINSTTATTFNINNLSANGSITLGASQGIQSRNNISNTFIAGGSAYDQGAEIYLGGPKSSFLPGVITFATGTGNNNTEAMRITDVGNVGIGTNTPTTRLDIQNGSSEAQIHIGPAASSGYVYGNTDEQGFYSNAGGQVAVGRNSSYVSLNANNITLNGPVNTNGYALSGCSTTAKAWATFNGTTGIGTTNGSGYNVTSVVKTGTGTYSIYFANPINTAYSIVATRRRTTGIGGGTATGPGIVIQASTTQSNVAYIESFSTSGAVQDGGINLFVFAP